MSERAQFFAMPDTEDKDVMDTARAERLVEGFQARPAVVKPADLPAADIVVEATPAAVFDEVARRWMRRPGSPPTSTSPPLWPWPASGRSAQPCGSGPIPACRATSIPCPWSPTPRG